MRRGRTRLLRLLATSALLAAAGLTFLPTGSGAQEPSVVGWWYRDVPLSGSDSVQSQSTGSPVVAHLRTGRASASQVPPPPALPPAPIPTVPPPAPVPDPGANVPTPSQAPDGGLLVAADVTGVRAMSALRFDAPDAGSAILSLTLAEGSTPSPGVRACPALSDWQPGPDQAWSTRPAHDCDRLAVSSTLSQDGTTMSWNLPDSFKPADRDVYDVLLVPTAGDGTPFQIAFNKPDVSALTITSMATVPPPEVEEPLPEGLPPSIDYFSSDGFDLSGVPDGGYVTPPVDTRSSQKASDGRRQTPLERAAEALENPTTRRVAALALIGLAAFAYWQAGQTVQRAPQLLGALGGSRSGASLAVPVAARPRGIGRFSRVRTERPSRF